MTKVRYEKPNFTAAILSTLVRKHLGENQMFEVNDVELREVDTHHLIVSQRSDGKILVGLYDKDSFEAFQKSMEEIHN